MQRSAVIGSLIVPRLKANDVCLDTVLLRRRMKENPVFVISEFTLKYKTDKLNPTELCRHKGEIVVEQRHQKRCSSRNAQWNRDPDYLTCLNHTTIRKYIAYQNRFEAQGNKKSVFFGTNIQVDPDSNNSDELYLASWLESLPETLRPNSSQDFLSKLPMLIDGINKPQVYLKVADVFTTIHQENLHLISVNVNFGPHPSDWFCIPPEYNDQFLQHMKGKGVDNFCKLAEGSYWPSVDELVAVGIPVYEFRQEDGDAVVTGVGTLHWVQGKGTAIHVSWNIGITSSEQLHAMWGTFQYNRDCMPKHNAVIPFVQMMWRIAEDMDFLNLLDVPTLHELRDILTTLEREHLEIESVFILLKLLLLRSRGHSAEAIVCDYCDRTIDDFDIVLQQEHNGDDRKDICFVCWRQHLKDGEGFKIQHVEVVSEKSRIGLQNVQNVIDARNGSGSVYEFGGCRASEEPKRKRVLFVKNSPKTLKLSSLYRASENDDNNESGKTKPKMEMPNVAPNPTPTASASHEVQVETNSSPPPKRTEHVFAKKTQPPTPSSEDDPRATNNAFQDALVEKSNPLFIKFPEEDDHSITEVDRRRCQKLQQGGETLKSILTDVVDEVVRGFMQSCRKALGSKTDPLYNRQNSEDLRPISRIWEGVKLGMGSLQEMEIKGLVDGYQKWASVEAFRYANATRYEELVYSGKLNPVTDPEAVKYNITRCYICEDEFGYHKLSDKDKARSDYLLNHARRYHVAGKGSFLCEQCRDSFWTKGQLTAHVKSTHGESGAARREKARVGMQNLRETRRKGLNVHIKSTQGKSGETRREGPQKRRTRKHPPVLPILLIDHNIPRKAKPAPDFDWRKAEEVSNAADGEPESDDPDFLVGTVQSKRRKVKVKRGSKPEATSDT